MSEERVGLPDPAQRATLLVPGVVVALYYSLRFGCGVSPKAIVQLSNRIRIGKGTLIKPFAVIQTSTGRITIGAHCAINNFVFISTVEADVTLSDYVRIGPHATILGAIRNFARKDQLIVEQGYRDRGTRIGRDVLIGAGAVIFDCTIGDGAVIGAGAVVTKDVGPYQVVAGVPAQVVGERRWMGPPRRARRCLEVMQSTVPTLRGR